VGVLLLVPLVAMQFTDEVVWTLSDFIVVGVLLTTIGVAFELAARRSGNLAVALGIAALGGFSILWGADADAPGLMLIGILLIGGACALGVRRSRRRTS
jgi:LPXTG-motif cell wall-anchored protein